jgi:hypothetical protein
MAFSLNDASSAMVTDYHHAMRKARTIPEKNVGPVAIGDRAHK